MINKITNFTGEETESTSTRRTQVFMATHEGEEYLPFLRRSFISFTYGDKPIEDFNLIATVSGDRWESHGYADFEDLTTTYDVINGQFYWNTHFHTNSFDFELSTDGMTQKQLDEFMRWFKAGEIKELVLAEHPNRAILARVSSVPTISMIPFELKQETKIDGVSYTISTTEYKGSIHLSLVSDDPFWYARVNIIGHFDQNSQYSDWRDANGREVADLLADPDILKIVTEDGTPITSMVKETIALGGEVYATVQAEIRSQICTPISAQEYEEAGSAAWRVKEKQENNTYNYYLGAAITTEGTPQEVAPGIIAGALMSSYGSIGMLPNEENHGYTYFYYAGTAPSPLRIEFDLFPQFDNETYLMIAPENKYTNNVTPYSSIYIESLSKQELSLTTPNIYTSYNQVINIFDTKVGETWVLIRKLIRDTVHHANVRKWANKVIDVIINNDESNTTCTSELSITAKQYMQQMFTAPIGASATYGIKAHFAIDSKTGESIGTFFYRDPDSDIEVNGEPAEEMAVLFKSEENVQDMLLSNNLIIKDRNFPDENGYIICWQDSNDTTRTYSHRVYHNFPVSLYNVQLAYQNLYL